LDNVGFGLRMRRVAKAEILERASRALALVGLAGLEGRRPKQLSGGQQQRVALARAIVIEPAVLLLDEPLSNLDAKLRKRMQLELKTLQRTLGITAIHVTHDQEEALTLADTVVIMNQGRAEQIGSPRDVYANPVSCFVADFLGKVNIVKGAVDTCDSKSGTMLFISNTKDRFTIQSDEELPAGTPAEIFIRPERIHLRRPTIPPQDNSLQAVVERVIFTGAIITFEVVTATGLRVLIDRQSGGPEEKLRSGDRVEIAVPSNAFRLIKAQTAVAE
jgi:ABC-type Fe3+/spermidine/putrescine transport system ATPase subunit